MVLATMSWSGLNVAMVVLGLLCMPLALLAGGKAASIKKRGGTHVRPSTTAGLFVVVGLLAVSMGVLSAQDDGHTIARCNMVRNDLASRHIATAGCGDRFHGEKVVRVMQAPCRQPIVLSYMVNDPPKRYTDKSGVHQIKVSIGVTEINGQSLPLANWFDAPSQLENYAIAICTTHGLVGAG